LEKPIRKGSMRKILSHAISSRSSFLTTRHRGHFHDGSFAFEDVHTFNSANPNDFYDKDAFAAAKDGSGTAYATITNFIEVCGILAFGFGQIDTPN
jgi:hypothetical protein